MPFASLVKRTSLVAAAIGFAALGLATVPAAASPLSGLLNGSHRPVLTELGNKPIEGGHGPVVNPNHPPFHICPLYSPECKGPPIANSNPPSGDHGPGPIVINRPPVIIAAPPVVVAASPAIIARPQPVYAAARPMQPQAPSTDTNVAAGEPCNCLTKQYQQDGSVVFRDLCTHEAAMATQADLQAQQQAVAQTPSPEQPQATPAR
jgi:hypothetical protein